MTAHALLRTLDSLPRARVLVLGDLVLDRYTWGNVDRVSPEAPVMVLEADRREIRLGGAANVGHMLRALDASATCLGVIGNDSDGQLLCDLLLDAGIPTDLVLTDASRPTTTKERFIGRAGLHHPSQILRVDSEDRTPLADWLEEAIVAHVARDIAQYDVLAISDYGKGVCTPRVLEISITAARGAGIPVVVDPARVADWQAYRGATFLKANRSETETVAGARFSHLREALALGRKLCQLYELQSLAVTLGSEGMAMIRRDGRGRLVPTQPRSVYDVTGAGDLLMAIFSLCFAGKVPLEQAAELASLAVSIKLERFGAAVVTRDEMRLELAKRLITDAAEQAGIEAVLAALELQSPPGVVAGRVTPVPDQAKGPSSKAI